MKRTAVINVVGLTPGLIGEHTPHLSAFAQRNALRAVVPPFPAVTCTAQSNFLTGKPPREHGIVANGWFNREQAEVQFWKQSNHLVQQPKLWEKLREQKPDFTCAKLFWWYNMYSSADFSITPRPAYPADGRKIFDIYTYPGNLREAIKADLGEFPFPAFWGPAAGTDSRMFKADSVSRWIAESAKWTEDRHHPDLSLIYLPHLDYNFQRFGPGHPVIPGDLGKIDSIVGDLIQYYGKAGVQVIVLSEYGITAVDRPIHLNRVFRKRGWIAIREELGLELLDCGASDAFAVADHQVAHVYIRDHRMIQKVAEAIRQEPGVDQVLDRKAQKEWGIDHSRSGELVVISDARSWFTYYYWEDDALAPDFARCVDIHRKPGYDPVELFIDPAIKLPQLKIAAKLLRKKLGFRMLMDLIPLDAGLIKGSHGRRPENQSDWPLLITPGESAGAKAPIDSTEVFDSLLASIRA